MKKFILLLISVAMGLFSFSCAAETDVLASAKEALNKYLSQNIDMENCYDDFSLPGSIENVPITWQCDSNYVTIEQKEDNYTAKITRPIGEDVSAKLEASLTRDGQIKTADYNITLRCRQAELGDGTGAAKSASFDVSLSKSGKTYAETLSGGIQTIYFSDINGLKFYFETDVYAFASYNILTDNYFGLILENKYGKVMLYVDACNGLTGKQCGYAIYSQGEWDFSARKKTLDINYANGECVKLGAAKDDTNVYFLVDGAPVFRLNETFANQTVDVGFISKDIHSVYTDISYKEANIDNTLSNIQQTELTLWSDEYKANLINGYSLSFASVEDSNFSEADDIYVKADRDENGITFFFIGFGNFSTTEHITAIFHTATSLGTGWNLDKTDKVIKINSDGKAYIKTGLSSYWDWTSPESGEKIAEGSVNINEYYFTIEINIPYTQLDGIVMQDEFKIMFSENRVNGSVEIYNAAPFTNNMRLNGAATGDPAYQTSYVTLLSSGAFSK